MSVDSSDIKIAALNVFADDLHSYLCSYAQFLTVERFSNPALEQEPDAPPERMLLRFAQAVVVLLGSGPNAVEHDLQKYELRFLKTVLRRFAALAKTHTAAVIITFIKENV